MSKRKSSHGIYELTCISHKCSRRFKVIYDIEEKPKGAPEPWYGKLTYPFTGCPFCGAWWCTGPLDATAYPKKKQASRVVQDSSLLQAMLQGQANMARGALGALGGGLAQGLGGTIGWRR